LALHVKSGKLISRPKPRTGSKAFVANGSHLNSSYFRIQQYSWWPLWEPQMSRITDTVPQMWIWRRN